MWVQTSMPDLFWSQQYSSQANLPTRGLSIWGSTACHLALQYPGTISCACSFHQLLPLLIPVQDTGHNLLSSFRHTISVKNSSVSPKAKLQTKNLSWDQHSGGQLQQLGLQTEMAKQNKCTGTAPTIPKNQELFLFPTKKFYPHVIRNAQCKLELVFGNSCNVTSPRFSCSPRTRSTQL